ncbi:nucleic acid-binding protein [Haladaptatus sp. W1]|uniref:Zn-ribbon domain-containing OB-fold protein n=1 Tax=Haladaptatus sp. W1 TaxID=1897478 RepID=UPI000849C4A5|nr:Zn-ribbon domain-containing OB-fold protein [Haladaptatus sp. W1]ODR80476.1 nucleic acid-binding protein [Haladaptatus sp. W1]
MSENEHGNSGYDEWLDAIDEGDAYYLECPNGHGSLPPRRICPECGETNLEDTPLPETGDIDTYTVIHVATPSFADDAPYTTAIADFGPVRVTAMAPDDVEVGESVSLTVGESKTNGDRLLQFERF